MEPESSVKNGIPPLVVNMMSWHWIELYMDGSEFSIYWCAVDILPAMCLFLIHRLDDKLFVFLLNLVMEKFAPVNYELRY